MNYKLTLLLSFLVIQSLASAQGFSIPNYTLSLDHATNYVLDSTVVKSNNTLSQKIKYTYDFRERLVNKHRRDDQANQIEITNFSYDINDSIVQQTYASGQSVPTLTSLTVMSRNTLKQTEHDTISYNSGSQFTVNTASSYTCDAAGYLIQLDRDAYNGSWAPLNHYEFQRNSAGKITYSLFQGWVNNAWENFTQSNTTYNSNNDITDRIFENWVTSSMSWKNNTRYRLAYTATHMDTFSVYTWNNAWINSSRYTYTPAGPLDTVTLDTWNGTAWEGYKRYIRTWASGRMTSVIEQGYTNSWNSAWKYEYIYDANGNHITTNVYAYNSPSNPWVLLIVSNHYYRTSTVGITERNINHDTKIYPVPSNSQLYIETSLPVRSGILYTSSGTEALQFQGSSVDLSSLTPGIYYIKLILEDGTSRLVKALKE